MVPAAKTSIFQAFCNKTVVIVHSSSAPSSATSTCIASGDPHYTTFDKRKYNFMGNCSYLMSKPCNDTSLPYFEVHADNENRFNRPTISYVKAVHVFVHAMKISILKGGTVQVRGLQNLLSSLRTRTQCDE